MNQNLPAYAVLAIALAVIGAVTYLTATGSVPATAAVAIFSYLIGTAGAAGVAHVVTQTKP